MDMLAPALGVALQCAGLLLVFAHWRARRRSDASGLVAGWTLMLLGAAPWLMSVSVERALAIASLAPMMFGLILLAPDAFPRLRTSSARKRNEGDAEAEPETRSSHRVSRNAARWVASLIAAPSVALAAAAAWQALVPGALADRVVASTGVLIVVWTFAALASLSTQRPWLLSLVLTVVALTMATSLHWTTLSGSV